MPTVKNRLGILIAQKAYEEQRNLPLRTVAEESGVSFSTIKAYLKQDDPVTRYDAEVIAKLCLYFGVGLQDLLVIEGEKPPKMQTFSTTGQLMTA